MMFVQLLQTVPEEQMSDLMRQVSIPQKSVHATETRKEDPFTELIASVMVNHTYL